MHKNIVVVGLGFGDESKGATVDAICRMTGARLVVRFNGGAQAAHNVVCPGGSVHHTFAQWGSGTFVGCTQTLLSKHMLVNPTRFLVEADVLRKKGVVLEHRVIVDARALITTPYHVWLNRVREYTRGAAKHGTTGMGISETVIDSYARPDSVLRCGDILRGKKHLIAKLEETSKMLIPELQRLGGRLEFDRLDVERIADMYLAFGALVTILSADGVCELLRKTEHVVFEGAQGVLLDQDFGFHPHTTWSKTTFVNAIDILHEAEINDPPFRLGVTRSYTTRHGAGPFPTETAHLTIPELHNDDEGMAGQFRIGCLDLPLLKYAVRCCYGVDGIVVSHMDCVPASYCARNRHIDNMEIPTNQFEQEGNTRLAWQPISVDDLEYVPAEFPSFIAEQLSARWVGSSSGPTAEDRQIFKEFL